MNVKTAVRVTATAIARAAFFVVVWAMIAGTLVL